MTSYRDKISSYMAQATSIEALAKTDSAIDNVLQTARWLLKNPLSDPTKGAVLTTIAGKLVGLAYALETKAADLKLDAEVAEIAKRGMKNESMLRRVGGDKKVTEARAEAEQEVEGMEVDVLLRKHLANHYQIASELALTMVTVIQSALRGLDRERFHAGREQNA